LILKGATASQYGLVFGISNLAAFLTAPIFAKFGPMIGPKYLYNTGAFLQALVGLAFGFLDYLENVNAFLGLSYFLRFKNDFFSGLKIKLEQHFLIEDFNSIGLSSSMYLWVI
jgi:hypothetical protein